MATRAVEPRSRRYDPAETRQRVLEAANMLFTTRGFVNTGTADIAREADVSEGSIFYHFGSKRNLLAELGRMYGERMVETMHRPGEELAHIGPRLTITRCFEYCETNKVWESVVGGSTKADCGTLTSTHEHIHHHPEAEPFYRASREVVVSWIERQLGAVLARQGRNDVNVPVAASLTYAAVSNGLDMAFQPNVTPEQRTAIRNEVIRYVESAEGWSEARARAND
jgi:AcrR family transcriptional regulator